jgi:hypothetical protein
MYASRRANPIANIQNKDERAKDHHEIKGL